MEKETVNVKLKTVLQKIIARREELGITQWDLAKQLHMTSNGYFKVEKGITKLDVKRLIEIAEVLEMNPTYFFEGM